mmetsp:Transcript_49436/g.87053  ORF Transcript_49436/g.87053 Transcript_49436/m.87053 type:complete len:177 (+) Transcript_49436:164-694(+)
MKASKLPIARRRRPLVTPLSPEALTEADEIGGMQRPASTSSLLVKSPGLQRSPSARTLILEAEVESPKHSASTTRRGSRSLTGPLTPSRRDSLPRSRSSLQLASGTPAQQKAAAQALRRRVCFCPSPKNTTHPITPYSKVYGMHPTYFDFDRRGRMQLTDEGVAKEMLEDALTAPD